MKSNFRQIMWTILVALAFVVGGKTVSAQEVTGTIVGTVRDASGAVVPGATVNITDSKKDNIVVRSLTANDDGEFTAPNLNSGIYQITVEAANFKKSVQTDIKLDVGQRRLIDFQLEAGSVSETVTVEAGAVAVELTTPTAGTVINGDQVRELLVNNRNWVQLVTLAPGVSNDLADQVYVGTTNPEGQANTVNISVNGARSSQNTFTVDGADVTDRGSNITIQAYPSLDSIGEFRVLRSLYPAESGRSGGGQVNVVTRSGGDRFSGSVYEFVRNDAFNANNFLNNAQTTPQFGRESNGKARRPPFRYNNFGWTIGGPVYFLGFGEGGDVFRRYDRTFFFFSQEFRRDNRFTAAQSVTVPDANLRRGVFPIDVCIGRNNTTESCAIPITTPGGGRLTAGTPIPAGFFSPAALSYVTNLYNNLPLPNAGTAANPYILNASLANKSDFRQEIVKIDHSFSDKFSMFYRFQNDKIPTIDGNSLFSSGSGLPNVATTSTNSPGRTHTVQMTYTVSPNVIVEGRYAYSYGAILSENIGLLSFKNFTAPITLPFANTRDRNPTIAPAAGTVLVNGFQNLSSFGPYDNFSTKNNYNGSLTWILGSHTTKFGVAYSRYRKNENAIAGNNEGRIEVIDQTLAPGLTLPGNVSTAQAQNLQRWANFLVGNIATFTQASFDYTADLRQIAFEGYAQDEWRARRNLTLYVGVRYSFFGSPYDENGRLSNFVPELYNRAAAPSVTGAGNRIAGTGNNCNGIIVNSQNYTTGPPVFNCTPTVSPYGKFIYNVPKTDFAPRVGLAWDPFGKGTTSIRTGYGIYHEQVLNGPALQNIGANPPYQVTATGNNVRLDNPNTGISFTATPPNIRAIDPNWKTPYMQHWSLDLQHQLTKDTVVTIGYYGSKGTNLIGLTEINSLPVGLARNSQCAPGNNYNGQATPFTSVNCQPAGYAFRNTAAAVGNPNVVGTTTFNDLLILDQLRPYRGYRSIAMVQPRYNSNYHSMQLSATHRFTGASQINMAYTWSKNLTDSQNDRTASPVDSYNIKAEWARAALDRRHVFNVNYVYELPFYQSQEGFIGKLLGGYQASGIVTYNTGLGFTAVTSNLDYAGLGIINANPSARPNQICDPNQNAPGTREQFFNIACFQLNPSNTATGLQNTPGTAGRNTIHGPSTFRVDFTLAKNLRFGETMNLQLRGEVYNVFNRTNFRSFSSLNVTSTLFGIVGAVRDPRTIQLGAKFSF